MTEGFFPAVVSSPIVLCCGDRNWTDRECIRGALSMLPDTTTVIHGAARGADTIAGEEAKRFGFSVYAFPADWNAHGKAAGPIRNQRMLDEGKPTMVYAFHSDIAKSKGTADMVKRARRIGVPVTIFTARQT